ncbi:hypothetical protein NUW54_g10229 [Trametes sanguinea]|uniref:Uncharacterized protein n=1 Tax=Trametes sanguinea TaxID=158606 RepID=A0ACC1P2R2_9APHY|nr:hypothetical protein NUW54_g10229 [Trametes sanguinea]
MLPSLDSLAEAVINSFFDPRQLLDEAFNALPNLQDVAFHLGFRKGIEKRRAVLPPPIEVLNVLGFDTDWKRMKAPARIQVERSWSDERIRHSLRRLKAKLSVDISDRPPSSRPEGMPHRSPLSRQDTHDTRSSSMIVPWDRSVVRSSAGSNDRPDVHSPTSYRIEVWMSTGLNATTRADIRHLQRSYLPPQASPVHEWLTIMLHRRAQSAFRYIFTYSAHQVQVPLLSVVHMSTPASYHPALVLHDFELLNAAHALVHPKSYHRLAARLPLWLSQTDAY